MMRVPCKTVGRRGNVLVFTLLVMILLAAFTAAQVMLTQKNMQQSSFVLSHSDLYRYAESGIDLSRHDLRYDFSGNGGDIGTASWAPENDTGRDGLPGTFDEGESDGLPTPGEPNVFPVAVGPAELGISLIAHVIDSGFASVKKVIGTATNGELMVTVEKYFLETVPVIPRAGAFFVEPDVALSLQGSAFRIDGNDRNPPRGTPGPGPAVPAIATVEGGSNESIIESQIRPRNYSQVTGASGSPSVGTATGVDFDQVFDQFKALQTTRLSPGTYSNPGILGNWDTGDLPVTYVKGDLVLDGQSSGAGVLVVEGNLSMSGQSLFMGMVLVNGNTTISGGGAGVHIWGSLVCGMTGTTSHATLSVSGTSDIYYSSGVLDRVQSSFLPSQELVYYKER